MSEIGDIAHYFKVSRRTQRGRLLSAVLSSVLATLEGWLLTSQMQVPADNAPLRIWAVYGLISAGFVLFSVLAVVSFMAWLKRWPTGEEDDYTGWAFLGAFGIGLCIIDWQAVIAVVAWVLISGVGSWLRTLMLEGFRRLSVVVGWAWTLLIVAAACLVAISDWESFAQYWQYFLCAWVLPMAVLDAVFAVGSWVWRGFREDLRGKTAGDQ